MRLTLHGLVLGTMTEYLQHLHHVNQSGRFLDHRQPTVQHQLHLQLTGACG